MPSAFPDPKNADKASTGGYRKLQETPDMLIWKKFVGDDDDGDEKWRVCRITV